MQRLITITEEELEGRDYLSEKFSKTMAWIDLQLIAEEGVVKTSYRALAARWKWSKSTTERYIARLAEKGVIGTPSGTKVGHSTLNISILYNYEWDKSGTPGGTVKERSPLLPLDSPSASPSLFPFPPTPPFTNDSTPPITPYNPPLPPSEKEYRISSNEDMLVNNGQNCPLVDPQLFPLPHIEKLSARRFAELWNEGCGRAAKVAKLTEDRKAKAKLRIEEFGETKAEQEETIQRILAKVRESDFLQGREKRWKITFDFLVRNSTNWVKILEGTYDNNYEYGDNSKHLSSAQRTPTRLKNYGESTI